MRTLVLWIAATGCSACGEDDTGPPPTLTATATRVEAEDALFHQDPRWLGGDAAYTVDLGGDRSVWLFGDSFIATSAAHKRSESAFVRNSIAVMAGRDLATATMQFAWRDGPPPTSYFPEVGDHWFWPVGGVRIPDGPLIVFMSELRSTPNQGLGFATAGQRAFRIPDPSGPPLTWTIEPTTARPPTFDAAATVACTTVDGDYLVAAVAGEGEHDTRLARWPLTEVGAGDLANPQWWTGMAWVPEASLGEPPPTVIPNGATECSLHYDAPTQTWIYLWSRGFGGTTLAIRTAPAVTGPWSSYRDVLRPDESNVDNAFVYAGKAHPQLRRTDGSIPVTFADNSFTFADLFDPTREPTLYWPHVARLSLTNTPAR